MRSEQLRFGILCLLAYVALAWAVRFDMRLGGQIASLVYPLDTFSMYAVPPGSDTSILLVRDRHGQVHRVTDFSAFDCDALPGSAPDPCARTHGIPYLYEEFAAWVANHPGPGDEPVELITRSWSVESWAVPSPIGDCVVARCRAVRP